MLLHYSLSKQGNFKVISKYYQIILLEFYRNNSAISLGLCNKIIGSQDFLKDFESI